MWRGPGGWSERVESGQSANDVDSVKTTCRSGNVGLLGAQENVHLRNNECKAQMERLQP